MGTSLLSRGGRWPWGQLVGALPAQGFYGPVRALAEPRILRSSERDERPQDGSHAMNATKNRKHATSAAAVAADTLREIIHVTPEGGYLGSEEDLLKRLGVSLPTFRQAARILEYEQLMIIRRGMNGGYFARRPDSATVARAAALYLYGSKVGFREILQASFPLLHEAVRLACECEDQTLIARFAEIVDQLRVEGGTMDMSSRIRWGRTIVTHITVMSRNAPIQLFIETLYGIYNNVDARESDRLPKLDPAWITPLRTLNLKLAEAVLDRDAELASFLFRRTEKSLLDWIAQATNQPPGDGGASLRTSGLPNS